MANPSRTMCLGFKLEDLRAGDQSRFMALLPPERQTERLPIGPEQAITVVLAPVERTDLDFLVAYLGPELAPGAFATVSDTEGVYVVVPSGWSEMPRQARDSQLESFLSGHGIPDTPDSFRARVAKTHELFGISNFEFAPGATELAI